MSDQVIVASTNPVKIDATRSGFVQMFPARDWAVRGVSAPSGVSDQPLSHEETLQGAINRAQAAQQIAPSAAYWVGVEGGLSRQNGRYEVFAYVVVTDGQRFGQAQTGVFYLPDEVARLIDDGMELGHADDVVFGRNNSKQAGGSIGILTDNAITRTDYYIHAVIMALIPFKQPHLSWG